MVKADGYGHGAVTVAQHLQKLGADYFGVATLEEGIELRDNKIDKPILVLGYTNPHQVCQLAKYNLTQTIFSNEYGVELVEELEKADVMLDCHIKIDTGMGRIGFLPTDDYVTEIQDIYKSRRINITGAYTHFSVADDTCESSLEFTRKQLDVFLEMCKKLECSGVELGIKHCGNSAVAVHHKEMQLDMVRVGIAQYGMSPSADLKTEINYMPVASFYTRVACVKEIKAGDTVSYGRRFTAEKNMKIATLTVGYADGYSRSLSGCGKVIINGEYAPVVGMVCMDQMMVDVSHIPQVKMGDRVTLVGCDGEKSITFTDIANLIGTIHYECICHIAPRVPRIYIDKESES